MGRKDCWKVLPLLVGLGCGASDSTDRTLAESSPDDAAGDSAGEGGEGASGQGVSALRDATLVCFYTEDDPIHPAATIEHRLELTEGVSSLHARLTLDSRFVDNTYGANAIGWDAISGGKKPKPRELEQLVGSDQATLRMLDASGETRLELKLDYISEDPSAPSGYRSLGVVGGDGKMLQGDASAVVRTSTSLDRNFNERGYTDFFESSPATDEQYSPNPLAPDWEFRVVYEAWVDLSAFPLGFGDAHVDFVHASPSKIGTNTVTVVRERCPPEWDCADSDTCGEPPPDGGCHLDSDCADDEVCFGGQCAPKAILI